VTAFMKIPFVLGIGLMLAAPLLRLWRMASPALLDGASIILALSAFGLTHPDCRFGQAANESDRHFTIYFWRVQFPCLSSH
jgi:hypothetical protein